MTTNGHDLDDVVLQIHLANNDIYPWISLRLNSHSNWGGRYRVHRNLEAARVEKQSQDGT